MPKYLKNSKGNTVVIDENPIAVGGQGTIHRILKPSSGNNIAKIFKDYSKAKQSESKIRFMIKNNPTLKSDPKIKAAIIWPSEMLYDGQHFAGFIMPEVKNTIPLSDLTRPAPPLHVKHGLGWKKFDVSNGNAHKIRLTLCYNIAQAIYELHRSKKYTIVDLKPDNIRITEQGLMSIIDLDSIQIKDSSKILYHAEVCTPEYAPPEHFQQQIVPRYEQIEESWDYFSFAVIAYHVLFTIHPFVGSHKKFTEIREFIEYGFFANGGKRGKFLVVPSLHDQFKKVGRPIQDLFIQCFDDGHACPSCRPNIEEWRDTLLDEIQRHSSSTGGKLSTGPLNPPPLKSGTVLKSANALYIMLFSVLFLFLSFQGYLLVKNKLDVTAPPVISSTDSDKSTPEDEPTGTKNMKADLQEELQQYSSGYSETQKVRILSLYDSKNMIVNVFSSSGTFVPSYSGENLENYLNRLRLTKIKNIQVIKISQNNGKNYIDIKEH